MRLRLPWILLALPALPVFGAEANLLRNGGFEGGFAATGVAEGWVPDSYSNWGDYDITYARETVHPHGGRACQRITINRIGYIGPDRTSWIGHGAAQIQGRPPVHLERGKVYRVRAWLRGTPGLVVRVQLRQANRPWWAYAEAAAILRPAWQPVHFLCTSQWEDPDARLLVSFAELGTVWIDDVSVEALSADEARRTAPPPQPGNLLQNGSFDLGRANWIGDFGWESVYDPKWTLEQGDHGWCLRAEGTPTAGPCVHSDTVPLSPGYRVDVSCRVRADRPCRVTFGAYRMAANHGLFYYCVTEADVGPEWTTLRASGEVPFMPDRPYAFIRLFADRPGTIWVDDVVLRQDGQTGPDEHPRAAILSDRHPAGLYTGGERPRLRLLSSVPPGVLAGLIRWRVEDTRGRVILSGTWRPGSGQQEKVVSGERLPRGWFRGVVTWRHGGRSFRNECTFCVLPPAGRSGKAEDSPFGAHFQPTPKYLELARAIGIRWIRLWPPRFTLWEAVEPKEGEWHWEDEPVRKLAREAGMRICGMLESPPSWAGGERYWEQWDRYVERVVSHYKEDIHVWEVQNEPDLKWWLSRPDGPSRAQNHVDVLRRTYAIIKRVDPEATVIGGCVSGFFAPKTDGLRFTEELFDLGALGCMDVLSYHYYHGHAAARPIDEGPHPVAECIAGVRQRMRAAGKEVPIVNSEGGVYNPAPAISYRPVTPDNYAPLSPGLVARLLVRLYVAQWAAGVQRFFYYNAFISGSPFAKAWDSFLEGDGQPRPCVAAYATMTWFLDGARFRRTDRPQPDVWLHRFDTPRGPLVVAWSRTGTERRVRLSNVAGAWDLMGNAIPVQAGTLSLGADPVYVRLAGPPQPVRTRAGRPE